jgi:hypothetical protein
MMTENYDIPSRTATFPSSPETVGTPYETEYLEPASMVSTDSTESADSTTQVAKDQAAGVGQGAAEAGQHVAGVAKEQAATVAAEASAQAKDLLAQTRTELSEQAALQQQRIATGIRALSEELSSMASRSQQPGMATDLVAQASDRAGDLAGWLDARDPGSLVQEVSSFARRRPGAFLALAAGAGLLAGRLTRGAVTGAHDDTPAAPAAAPPAPVVEPAEVYEPVGTYASVPTWDGQVQP